MSKVLERLRKKRGRLVTIDSEDFYVRSLTIGELRRLDALKPDERTGFIVGCALCDGADGGQEIPKGGDEDDSQWAARVLEELADVPSETIKCLADGVAAIGKTPNLETVVKN